MVDDFITRAATPPRKVHGSAKSRQGDTKPVRQRDRAHAEDQTEIGNASIKRSASENLSDHASDHRVLPKQDEEYERMLEEAAQKLRKRRRTDESVKAYLECHKWDEATAIRLGYKSRLCQFFEKGTCHKGLLCQYAHGKSDLIQMQAAKAHSEVGTLSVLGPQIPNAATSPNLPSSTGFAGGFTGHVGFAGLVSQSVNVGALGNGFGCIAMPALPSVGTSGPSELIAGVGVLAVGFPTGVSVDSMKGAQVPGESAVPRGPKPMRCTLFPRGLCRLGNMCPWAHNAEELILGRSICTANSPTALNNFSTAPATGQLSLASVDCAAIGSNITMTCPAPIVQQIPLMMPNVGGVASMNTQQALMTGTGCSVEQ